MRNQKQQLEGGELLAGGGGDNDHDSDYRSRTKTKRYWTVEEDDQLRNLVKEYGPRRWPTLARRLSERLPETKPRTATQCRDRWLHHLDPNICHAPITGKELDDMLTLQKTYGNKWTQIARYLGNGRTGLQVKNAWKLCQRRARRSSLTNTNQHPHHLMPFKKRDSGLKSTKAKAIRVRLKSYRDSQRSIPCKQRHACFVLESPDSSPRKMTNSAFDTLSLIQKMAQPQPLNTTPASSTAATTTATFSNIHHC